MTRPLRWAAVVAFAASLAIAGCGGQNYEKTSSTSTSSERSSPAASSGSAEHAGQVADTTGHGHGQDGEMMAANCTCSTDKAGCRCGHCVGAVDVCHCRH